MPLTPYYQDDHVTLYHGSCMDVLPQLPLASVDLVLTDPPYGVNYVSSHRKKGDDLKAPIHADNNLNAMRDSMPLLDRVLKLDRHIYMFGATLRLGEVQDMINTFWKVKNVIVWDKGDAGTTRDTEAGYAWNWEPIVYANKGRRELFGTRPRSIYRYDWGAASIRASNMDLHPTVKPVGLLQWLIAKSSLPGETVIDPFAGSGTTLRASKNMGRHSIGIEISEVFCERAARLCSQVTMTLDNTTLLAHESVPQVERKYKPSKPSHSAAPITPTTSGGKPIVVDNDKMPMLQRLWPTAEEQEKNNG